MEGFIVAAKVGELAPGDMRLVMVGEERIALANVDGAYYAFGDACTHLDCALSEGTLEGESVECPCHGSQFNVKTGAVEEGPAQDPVPVYAVCIEGDQVLIGRGRGSGG